MKIGRTAMCLAALGLGIGAATAQADVLVDQAPNYTNAYFSDTGGDFSNQQMAENFMLASSNTVGQIGVWGVYFPNNIPSDNFSINIYADNGGNVPGSLLHSENVAASRVDTGNDAFGCDVYQYNFVLASPFAATGGVQYWISVVNHAGSPNNNWGWMTANADAIGAYTLDSAGSWNQLGESLSLHLETPVPAPASMAFAGLVGIGALRRRR